VNTNPASNKSPSPVPAKPSEGFSTHIPSLRNTFPTPPDHPEPLPTGPSGAVKTIFIIVLALTAIFIYRQWRGGSSAMAGWQPTWEKAVDESHEKKKPMLVLFSADWCAA
jgi:hypothetical protein